MCVCVCVGSVFVCVCVCVCVCGGGGGGGGGGGRRSEGWLAASCLNEKCRSLSIMSVQHLKIGASAMPHEA